ncbi:hypothetical protein [Halobacterium bonnevillei]|uniref:Alanyl-tRNA synthetase n=1 Tax=Halobacterium bonnevillei TaxID=2692200 RepID=A0A6B0SIY0_9EURY|nr:hypothetical protein [Halobacterium bonnevillei]MXR19473.1 hypothetical protein [Halobacterium bonnevillei]
MNSMITALLVAGVILAVTNAYWYRREKALRDGLETSVGWDETIAGLDGADTADRRLDAVADILDTSVEDVPAAARSLDSKVRDLQRSVEETRETWAGIAANALRTDAVEPDDVLVVHLVGGTGEDARALSSALDQDNLTAVCAHEDVTFVLTAGTMSDESAIAVARAAMVDAPGGVGGSETLAQGGGDTDCFDSIEEALAEKAGNNLTVVSLGRN